MRFKKFKNWLVKKITGHTIEEIENLEADYEQKTAEADDLNDSLNEAIAQLEKYKKEHTYFTRELVYNDSDIVNLQLNTTVPKHIFEEHPEFIKETIFNELFKSEDLKNCINIRTEVDPSTFEHNIKVLAELKLLRDKK